MKRSFALSLCAVALAAFALSEVRADDVEIDLEYNSTTNTWQLFAEVIISADTMDADGSFGLSAVRGVLDNIDFGTLGDAVTIEAAGAINPIPTDDGDRDPVLDLGGGTLDVLYGQNISSDPAIVTGIGATSGRDLIASGTYSGAAPAYGTDTTGDTDLFTEALFLGGATAGPSAVDPDNIVLNDPVDVGGSPLGDFEPDGDVDNDDLVVLLGNFGPFAGGPSGGDFDSSGTVDNDDLVVLLGNFTGPLAVAAVNAVPEPTSILLLVSSLALVAGRRQSK